MFGQTTLGSGNLNDASNRVYRIEIEGMRQNVNPDKVSYSIRNSGRTFITVPYNRMNEQLQRINRMGGKVLSIEPLTPDGDAQAKAEATAAHQAVNAWGKPKSTGSDHPEAEHSEAERSEAKESKKRASKKAED
jgi:phycocyanin-associated rod protein